MRLAAAALLLLLSAPSGPQRFRYRRALALPKASASVCAALDEQVYAHAAPQLSDLRLLDSAGRELPYALTMSQVAPGEDLAPVRNLTTRAGRTSFDLLMPPRPYSTVNLDLRAADDRTPSFLLTANVTGRASLTSLAGPSLGAFRLFNLPADSLGSGTALHLAEASYPVLHVELVPVRRPAGGPFGPYLAKDPTPIQVRPALVPASRQDQTRFTTLAETTRILQAGDSTQATFDIPARVPVERVSFALDPASKINFSRQISVLGQFTGDPEAIRAGRGQESLSGFIDRIHLPLPPPGPGLDSLKLSVDTIFGLNGKRAMQVIVTVPNGNLPPLPLRSVSLQMRERKICFAPPPGGAEMVYGAAALPAPAYDYTPASDAAEARLAPEQLNPAYDPAPPAPPRRRSFLPWLLLADLPLLLAFLYFTLKKARPKR